MKEDKDNRKSNSQKMWKNIGGNILIWVLIIIMSITALQLFSSDYKPKVIDYTQFQYYLENDLISSGVITGKSFRGTFSQPVTIESSNGQSSKEYSKFIAILPEITDDITRSWIEKGINCKFEEEGV